jgi:site-specific DNA-methyltransferase (adenine-specific)
MPKKKYIPGLAAFYFKPNYSWTIEEAIDLFSNKSIEQYNIIYYEDCINGMENLSAESIDLVVADPPFGLGFSGKEAQYNRNKELVIDGYNDIPKEEYTKITNDWISQLPRIMKETASAYIFSGWTNLKDILIAIDNAKLTVINHIIWKYQFAVYTKSRKFATSHYHILFVVKNLKKYFYNKIEHYTLDIWEISRKYAKNIRKNGTKLPINLVSKCINYSSKPGDIVLDPFIGNGTTAISCKQNYRKYIGFEINKAMKPIINSGLAATKVGESYIPYSEIPINIAALAKKYPKAYKIYLEKEKN